VRIFQQLVSEEGNTMVNTMKKLWADEEGQGMVEYGLIVGIISVAVIASLTSMKGSLVQLFQKATEGLNTGASAAGG
jgi:pilus assembly protein Flp/PilA